ncbi:MAG TPA: TetR/AcrR family transcriptional regulator [Lactobacillaceae bacterium]|jgi:AcrR family transcriptional regulator
MTETRRRGDDLENTIYAATLKILARDGYEKTTFAQIAREAKTSRTVLYRRWDTIFELVHDAIEHDVPEMRVENLQYDTGSLRGDLIALGKIFQAHGNKVNDEFVRASVQEFSSGSALAKRMMRQVEQVNFQIIGEICARAIERGELQQLPSKRVQLLLFEILRYQGILLRSQALEDVEGIVDEIILPAYYAGGRG